MWVKARLWYAGGLRGGEFGFKSEWRVVGGGRFV